MSHTVILALVAVMSDQVQMAIIAVIAAAVTAIPSVILALKGTNKKIDDLSVQVDGRLTKLLEEVSKSRHAEGMLAGKAEEKAEGEKVKMVDALIAKSAPTPPVTAAPVTPLVSEPVKIDVVSMPDQSKADL